MIIQPMNQTVIAGPSNPVEAGTDSELVLKSLQGLAPLDNLGVIRAAGPDAVSFLQGQLTQDFALLTMDQARLAAYCSAKGRMQASFIGFKRSPDEILLLCSRDLLDAALKRLSMFVLRSKVRLSDASAEFRICALAGSAIDAVAAEPGAAWSRVSLEGADLVFLHPAVGVPRALWIAALGTALPQAASMDVALWRWSEVRSAVATITAPIAEAFVPQMLNYESVGGVNFKKGCYPGQEVVARSQFRGTLKRRAYLVHCASMLTVADEIFPPGDPERPCGTVAQAAAAPSGGWDAIVSLQVAAAQSGALVSASGAALAILPLPYSLLDDI